MTDKKVWFITGAGRGMGVAFAKAAVTALAGITEEAWTQRIDVNLGGVFLFLAQHMTGNIEGERT